MVEGEEKRPIARMERVRALARATPISGRAKLALELLWDFKVMLLALHLVAPDGKPRLPTQARLRRVPFRALSLAARFKF